MQGSITTAGLESEGDEAASVRVGRRERMPIAFAEEERILI